MLTLKINRTLYPHGGVDVYDETDCIFSINKIESKNAKLNFFVSSSVFSITWMNRLKCKGVYMAKCMEKSFYHLITD